MSNYEKLKEAERVLHELNTTKEVVKIRRGDDVSEWTPQDIPALERYVKKLSAELNINKARRRPARVF